MTAHTTQRHKKEIPQEMVTATIGGRAKEPAPVGEEAIAAAAARKELAWEQQAEWREEIIRCLNNMAKGLTKFPLAEDSWEEPDWEADPATWPPTAKILLLHVRADNAITRAAMARHFGKPAFCRQCDPEGAYGREWTCWDCREHTDEARQVRSLAKTLFQLAGNINEDGPERAQDGASAPERVRAVL